MNIERNESGDVTLDPNREKYGNFNGLNPAEVERLALLAEECGEVVQIIGKVLRHGYESTHPNGGPTNRELLAMEIGDLFFIIHLMCAKEDISFSEIVKAEDNKAKKINKYLHHNTVNE